MSEEKVFTDQADEEDRNGSSNMKEQSAFSRRDFLKKTMAVTSGLALFSMLPKFATGVWAEMAFPAAACPPGQPLQEIMEIKSSGKTLNAVLKILDEKRTYLAAKCVPNTAQMRYISGYDPSTPSKVWPPNPKVMNPGPTLRARLGDRVQITLLNHVDVTKFGDSLDVAEKGKGCDTHTTEGIGNTYPGNPSFDTPPNCFHGSSSTNLHFHGTHISPSGVADNVLLNIRPSPRGADGKPVVNEDSVKAIFDEIFADCEKNEQPLEWKDWPQKWQDWQKELLIDYDNTTPWQGQSPKPGQPALPHDQQLWVQNEDAIAKHELPQYYIGAFPNCFKITEWNEKTPTPVMGQAPGTHWYHSHKHGSTALNLANGMAGALIIEGDYDDKLKPFYTKQQVLVVQQYTEQMKELRAANVSQVSDLIFVNGQYTPVLQMNPNEMQFWRVVNACYGAFVRIDAPKGIKWVQTAQDGVQFHQKNYNPLVTNAAFPAPAKSKAPFGSFAPGNRIDLLVQAPSAPGKYNVTYGGGTVLFTVDVRQDPKVKPIPTPMPFPKPAEFPVQPEFLADLKFSDVKVRRDLHFATNPTPYPSPSPAYPIPKKHTIDGKQFSEHIDQTMLLGGTEEWTLYNDTPDGAAHPFHIHVNPFQVVEIKDPKQNGGVAVKLPAPWIWWDNFAIPPGGYVKILSKFVDFTGKFVLHCHILDHEDRGMMQLVQVVSNMTNMKHN